jgi:hypothetical protein
LTTVKLWTKIECNNKKFWNFCVEGGYDMKHTPTIRAELDSYLQQKGLSLAQFGQLAGMNRGIVSAIVTGNKSMSVNQLDLITEAMDLPEGYFYDLFIENYIIDPPPRI